MRNYVLTDGKRHFKNDKTIMSGVCGVRLLLHTYPTGTDSEYSKGRVECLNIDLSFSGADEQKKWLQDLIEEATKKLEQLESKKESNILPINATAEN
jgi:3-deoxy-D-manno-octulosonate 8-phosphate phosphatase KdsC-like HAD superfamily phosphatase